MSGIEPGSLPKPVSRAERRKWDDDDRRDAERQQQRRPNAPPDIAPLYDRCSQSGYQTHRFVVSRRLKTVVCEFCHRPERECVVKP